MRTCPTCNEPAPDDAAWCEACGSDLDGPAGVAPVAGAVFAGSQPPGALPGDALPTEALRVYSEPCVACAAPPEEITHDGYCEQCGQRQPSPRDHEVVDLAHVGGVSDKGKSHHRNEDAMALAAIADRSILIVCDGVSSTELPDEASDAAAEAALNVLLDSEATDEVFAAASEAAKAGVSAIWRSSQQASNPPSCTFVAAVAEPVSDQMVVRVAWLGDSRAYWIASDTGQASADQDRAQLLTTDHSWAQEQLRLGELDPEAIASDPRAHSITRWIGIDAGDVTPEIAEYTFTGPGRLVVCSDGLWNYAPEAEALAALIDDRTRDDQLSASALCEQLVAFANDSGGHDNITVVIADFSDRVAPEAEDQEAPETEDKGEPTSG